MPIIDFAWTFPSYVLARSFERDPVSGNVRLTPVSQIMAPLVADVLPHIAIFTDADLAETFRDRVAAAAEMQLLEFTGPAQLKTLLVSLRDRFQYAVMDLNPQSRVCRRFLLDEILQAIDDWIDGLDSESRDSSS